MTTINKLDQLDLSETYSYADYLTWQFDETIELIKGKIHLMSPAPNVRHQSIVTELGGQLYPFFRKKPCKLFYAPFDVRLYNERKSILTNQDIFTVVQPDLCVICDPNQLDAQGCNGAPDWIIAAIPNLKPYIFLGIFLLPIQHKCHEMFPAIKRNNLK